MVPEDRVALTHPSYWQQAPKKGKTGKKGVRLEKEDSTVSHRPKTPASRSSARTYSSNNTQSPSLHGNSSFSFGDSSGGLGLFQASPAPPPYGDALGKPFPFQDSADEQEALPKLKGTCWPGMDLFDAANDEMKRMRNQRKAKSVIDQMEAFSATISRDEFVYNLDLDLERIRDVYSSPSVESSPVSLQTLRWLAMIF